MSPETLVRLANLTAPRKPGRGPRIYPDPFADPGAAAEALGLASVEARDLNELSVLHRIVVRLVNRMLAGMPVDEQVALLNGVVGASTARTGLEVDDDGPGNDTDRRRLRLRERLQWSDPTPAAALARQVISELGQITPERLRRCARAECDLVFYDTTRSNTRRWHAESPCGLRERQARHRGTSPRDE
jgi:CGNR zinc finger